MVNKPDCNDDDSALLKQAKVIKKIKSHQKNIEMGGRRRDREAVIEREREREEREGEGQSEREGGRERKRQREG